MSAFFYFFESITANQLAPSGRLDRGVLLEYGLDDVLSDVRDVPDHAIITPTTKGPSGLPGVLLFPVVNGESPKIPAMHDGMQWSHSQIGNRKGPAPWIGILPAEPPRPEELLRSPNFPGYHVADRHGRSWSVPIIRGLDRPYGTLPTDFEWSDDDFTPRPVLRQRYQQLWDDSARVWDLCYESGTPQQLADPWVAGFVARLLSINHRVGPRELNILRSIDLAPFDAASIVDFASAAVDVHAVIEFTKSQKKTPTMPTVAESAMPGGTTSTPGTPGDVQDGGQAEASCE